jgi:hypothetical protein
MEPEVETGDVQPPDPEPALIALAERAEAAIANAGDSPGREYANRLRSGPRAAWIKYLKGEGKAPSHPPKDEAVAMLERLLERAEAGPQWPTPGQFNVPRTSVTPEIDGALEDEAWRQAAQWNDIYPFNDTAAEGPGTTWLMTWDSTHLYVAFDCADKDVVAPDRDRDGHVYFDDCVEVFILPEFRFHTYWELVIAPNGSVFDAVHHKKLHAWGSMSDKTQDIEGLRYASSVRGTLNNSEDVDEGYAAEIAIPFDQLPEYTRCTPEPGDVLHVMLVRLDRSDGEFKTYAFRPLQAWGHNIWNHATLVLSAKGDKK